MRRPCCDGPLRNKFNRQPKKGARYAQGVLGGDYRSVKNPEAWKAYAKLAVPPIESAGGCFLARSNPAKTYEAGMNERVVLVEFPSLDKAVACRDTPAYKEALKALGTDNVERDMRVVEGVA